MPIWAISHSMWNDIFVLGAPLVEKILRPIVVYGFLVIVLRIFGKRELAQLTRSTWWCCCPFQHGAERHYRQTDNSLSGGLIGAFTLLA